MCTRSRPIATLSLGSSCVLSGCVQQIVCTLDQLGCIDESRVRNQSDGLLALALKQCEVHERAIDKLLQGRVGLPKHGSERFVCGGEER